jgi:photosystem II stability/assembly factor-like uncharacterized protein
MFDVRRSRSYSFPVLHRRNVSLCEVVSPVQERLTGILRERIRTAVTDVEASGGDSWTDVPQPSTDALFDLWFADSQNGFAIGSAAGSASTVLLKTGNGGGFWEEMSHDLPDLSTPSVSFGDALTGTVLGAAAEGLIYRTEDGGSTWVVEQAPGLNMLLLDVVMLGPDHGVAVGQGGLIYRRQ